MYECFCGEHPRIGDGPAATARAISEPVPPLAEIRPDLPQPLTDAIDGALDPDPELRPLASELEAVLGSHEGELDGSQLPPVLHPAEPTPPRDPVGSLARFAPGLSVGALCLAAMVAVGAPPPAMAAAPLAALVALARPRAGLALGAGVLIAWLLIGAGQPGSALVAALLVAPLILIPAGGGGAIALPGLAPVLGVAGLAPVYPALAGLARGAAERALLGATGYLWLAALETAGDRTLLLGAETPATDGWQQSVGAALSDVILPLLSLGVLAVATLWALAAVTLPLLVRGRSPVLDMVGALIWAAALISAHRVLAGPDGEPTGLLLASLLAATVTVLVARRLRPRAPLRSRSLEETGTGATL
jgi:hypothetical protein